MIFWLVSWRGDYTFWSLKNFKGLGNHSCYLLHLTMALTLQKCHLFNFLHAQNP
jgi:hypothetical protein